VPLGVKRRRERRYLKAVLSFHVCLINVRYETLTQRHSSFCFLRRWFAICQPPTSFSRGKKPLVPVLKSALNPGDIPFSQSCFAASITPLRQLISFSRSDGYCMTCVSREILISLWLWTDTPRTMICRRSNLFGSVSLPSHV